MYIKQSKILQIKKNIPTFLYTVREIQPINWYVEMSPAARLGWLRCGRWAPPPPPPPCPESPPAIACTCMLAQSQYDYAGYGFDPQTTLIMYIYTQYCMPNGKELRNKYNKCNHELTKYRLQNKNIWVECFQKTVWMWPFVLICCSEKWFTNNILYISNRVGDPDLSGPDTKNKKYSDFSNFSCGKPWRNTVIWRRKKLSWKGLRIMYTNIPLRI